MRVNIFTIIDSNNKQRKYYPDFFLPNSNKWIEIKGKRYIRIDDNKRLLSVPNISIIYSTELRDEKYVLSKI